MMQNLHVLEKEPFINRISTDCKKRIKTLSIEDHDFDPMITSIIGPTKTAKKKVI